MRLLWLLVLTSGCALDDSSALFVSRARATADVTRPDALVSLEVALDVYGAPLHDEELSLDRAWLGIEWDRPLAVALEPATLHVPADTAVFADLTNVGVTSRELAAHCQTTVPITVYLAIAGENAMIMSNADELAVFCAP